MEPHLRLRPGQRTLPPEQRAEVGRFVEGCHQAQLSTEPVDETEAAALLKQAYEAAGLVAPQRIHWLESPLQMLAIWVPEGVWHRIHDPPVRRDSRWPSGQSSTLESVWNQVYVEVKKRVEASLRGSFQKGRNQTNVYALVLSYARDSTLHSFWGRARNNIWHVLLNHLHSKSASQTVEASVSAYEPNPYLVWYSFFDVYLAPHELHALAQLTQRVSGCWLGKEDALLVRRPKRLCLDEAGRPHSATGKALEYQDGWGLFVWHGVEVSEKVILAPEALTHADFLSEPNLEVRRIIQERMGERFVWELGGKFIDGGHRASSTK